MANFRLAMSSGHHRIVLTNLTATPPYAEPFWDEPAYCPKDMSVVGVRQWLDDTPNDPRGLMRIEMRCMNSKRDVASNETCNDSECPWIQSGMPPPFFGMSSNHHLHSFSKHAMGPKMTSYFFMGHSMKTTTL